MGGRLWFVYFLKKVCCLADLGQHLPQEIQSHGLSRVPDTLLVKQLLVLFQWVQVECVSVRGKMEMYFLKLATGQFGLSDSAKM